MVDTNTEPGLRACIIEYARSRGAASMYEMARGGSPALAAFGRNQDIIGWRRFLEGMVALGGREIQAEYMRALGLRGNAKS